MRHRRPRPDGAGPRRGGSPHTRGIDLLRCSGGAQKADDDPPRAVVAAVAILLAALVGIGPLTPSVAAIGVDTTAPGGPARLSVCVQRRHRRVHRRLRHGVGHRLGGQPSTASSPAWVGAFFVQDGIDKDFPGGFGIYDGRPHDWADADGYLPAQITTFPSGGATVSITEFADELTLAGRPYVAVYCRVVVGTRRAQAVTADPEPSPGLVPLDTASDCGAAHGAVAP